MVETDAQTIGAVALIGIGGFVMWGAYQRIQIADYWEAIGRAVVGIGLLYGGIWLFQQRAEGEKEEVKENIKEKITAAIESVDGED